MASPAVRLQQGNRGTHPHERATLEFELFSGSRTSFTRDVTVETFKQEIAEALKNYERHVVCIDKTPDECEDALKRLMEKAIKAYDTRGPNLRHGIALDKQVTIILSQTENGRPLCGIYFNLHSPYQKKSTSKTGKPAS